MHQRGTGSISSFYKSTVIFHFPLEKIRHFLYDYDMSAESAIKAAVLLCAHAAIFCATGGAWIFGQIHSRSNLQGTQIITVEPTAWAHAGLTCTQAVFDAPA